MHEKLAFDMRPMTQQDIPSILEVYRQCEDFLCLGPVPHASLKMVMADLEHSRESGGDFCCLFDANGYMFGIVDYTPQMTGDEADKAFFSLLMIAKDYRSRGYGRAVVEKVEAEIRRNAAIGEVLSGVQHNNPRAIKFWTSMGYEIVGEAEALPDGTTAYPLRKKIK